MTIRRILKRHTSLRLGDSATTAVITGELAHMHRDSALVWSRVEAGKPKGGSEKKVGTFSAHLLRRQLDACCL